MKLFKLEMLIQAPSMTSAAEDLFEVLSEKAQTTRPVVLLSLAEIDQVTGEVVDAFVSDPTLHPNG
jgi:hypothetical protein